MENEDDKPPSYSDAMAAIADDRRRQGFQSLHEFTPVGMSRQFSDVIVILPPSRESLSSDGSSLQILDLSLPDEPPPPYTEHPSLSNQISTQIILPRAPSLSLPASNSTNDARNTNTYLIMPNCSTPTPKSHVVQDEYNRVIPSAPSASYEFTAPRDGSWAPTDYGLAVGATIDSKPSTQEHKDDVS